MVVCVSSPARLHDNCPNAYLSGVLMYAELQMKYFLQWGNKAKDSVFVWQRSYIFAQVIHTKYHLPLLEVFVVL